VSLQKKVRSTLYMQGFYVRVEFIERYFSSRTEPVLRNSGQSFNASRPGKPRCKECIKLG
jgi:hypothetical protein